MRFLVCMTGATGSIYGVRLLKMLKQLGHEVHFIVSHFAEQIMIHETGLSKNQQYQDQVKRVGVRITAAVEKYLEQPFTLSF